MTKQTKKHFTVSLDRNAWTGKAVTIKDFTDRGYEVEESRKFGKFDVFHGIHKVATLFETKAEAIAYKNYINI